MWSFSKQKLPQRWLEVGGGEGRSPRQVLLDADSQEPETVHLLHLSSTEVDRGVSSPLFSKINEQFIGFTDSSFICPHFFSDGLTFLIRWESVGRRSREIWSD